MWSVGQKVKAKALRVSWLRCFQGQSLKALGVLLSLGLASCTPTFVVDVEDTSGSLSSANLGAPGGLTAIPGNGSVVLIWNAVDGATEYVVLRALASSGPFNALGSRVTGLTFTDTTVSNTVTYYYQVAGLAIDKVFHVTPMASNIR